MKEKKECNNHEWIPLLGFYKKRSITTSLFTCLLCGDLKVGEQTIKISQYRLDMGGLPINSVAGIKLMNDEPIAVLADKTASGLIVSMTYGETIAKGDLLYFSGGKVYRADLEGISTHYYPVMGLALADAGSGSTNNVLLHGVYRDDSRYGFTVGGVVYLSTAGTETQAQPTAQDNVIQVVGIAIHADRIYFNPSPDYITHV